MSRGGRDYIHADVEYRGKETITGHREFFDTVYDETEAEAEARIAVWEGENPGRSSWEMQDPDNPWYRKRHQESRGILPFTDVRTFGPYASLAAARRSVGVGAGGFRKELLTERNGHPHLTVLEVEIGRVTWTPAADEED